MFTENERAEVSQNDIFFLKKTKVIDFKSRSILITQIFFLPII